MGMIVTILYFALTAFYWVIIAQVVISWLVAFQVMNLSNPQARNLVNLLDKITAPVYKPLRKFIPPIAGIDITPIIVIFGVIILRDMALPNLLNMVN